MCISVYMFRSVVECALTPEREGHPHLMFFEEKTPVVIDNGSGWLKAGFGGEEQPKSVFPTLVGFPEDAVSLGEVCCFFSPPVAFFCLPVVAVSRPFTSPLPCSVVILSPCVRDCGVCICVCACVRVHIFVCTYEHVHVCVCV